MEDYKKQKEAMLSMMLVRPGDGDKKVNYQNCKYCQSNVYMLVKKCPYNHNS